jgi:hypothetical protein
MLANGARPPSAITVDKEFLGSRRPSARLMLANLREDVDNAIYAGPDNSGRPRCCRPAWTGSPSGRPPSRPR